MRRYPAYKNSGVEWLGEVPEGWEVRPVKGAFDVVGGTTPKSDVPEYWDGNINWVTPADLSNLPSRFIYESGRQITEAGLGSCGTTVVPSGSIVLSVRAPIGSLAIAAREVCTNQGCKALVPTTRAQSDFFYFVLETAREALNILGRGSTFLELSGDQLAAFRVPLPPLPEQIAIAAFLDRETARIDALVAEQRRLIDLLREKRQAVISHAVTKGLNPNAPLKPSGIDWLGDVPEGWEVVRLKRDLLFLTSGSRGWAEHYADDGALFLRIGNLPREDMVLDLSDIQRVAVPEGSEGQRTRVEAGDVLFSITAYLGSVAVVPPDLETAYVSQHVALARLRQNTMLPDWVAYVTLSLVGKTYLAEQGYGGTKVQLSLDDVANMIVPLPPREEQREILAYIADQTRKLDTLTATAETAITLLQERRAALISAAVTGKIDVRENLTDEVAA